MKKPSGAIVGGKVAAALVAPNQTKMSIIAIII